MSDTLSVYEQPKIVVFNKLVTAYDILNIEKVDVVKLRQHAYQGILKISYTDPPSEDIKTVAQ